MQGQDSKSVYLMVYKINIDTFFKCLFKKIRIMYIIKYNNLKNYDYEIKLYNILPAP